MSNNANNISLSDVKTCDIIKEIYQDYFTDEFVLKNLAIMNENLSKDSLDEYLSITTSEIFDLDLFDINDASINNHAVIDEKADELQQDNQATEEQDLTPQEAVQSDNQDTCVNSVNDIFSLTVSKDHMRAELTIKKIKDLTEQPKIKVQEIVSFLLANKVIYNVKREFLKRICLRPVYNKPFLVAMGLAPVHGVNGYVKNYFDVDKNTTPTLDEHGNVDFKNLENSLAATKDSLLSEIIEPTLPISGKDVYGKIINGKPGKPTTLKAGTNTYLSLDKNKLYAGCDGQILYKNNTASIGRELRVDFVGNETGNIDFAGNVIILGDVLSGYSVIADGNIVVHGSVEGAILKASGDITISKGFNGAGTGKAFCEGTFTSKFIENATVTATTCIKADAVLNSNLYCEDKIILTGKRGCFIGGDCTAGTLIQAQNIGNTSNIPTSVTISIAAQLQKEINLLTPIIEEQQKSLNYVEELFFSLKSQIESANASKPVKGLILLKLIFYYEKIAIPLNLELKRLNALKAKKDISYSSKIIVKSTIHSNVVVTINNCVKKLASQYQYTSIVADEETQKIVFRPL